MTLSTVHRVKGEEWEFVCVADVRRGMMPHRLAEDVEEERRILHVAITRAREQVLVLTDAARPSPFVAELLEPAAPVAASEPAVAPLAQLWRERRRTRS